MSSIWDKYTNLSVTFLNWGKLQENHSFQANSEAEAFLPHKYVDNNIYVMSHLAQKVIAQLPGPQMPQPWIQTTGCASQRLHTSGIYDQVCERGLWACVLEHDEF